MQTKFEQLLDYLINEETDKANELFHEIVVEKSRTIYENLIAEEEKEDDDEAKKDEKAEESVEENFGGESVIEIGGDSTDDLLGDVEFGDEEGEDDGLEADPMGGDEPEMGGEGDVEDRVQDLEDALDELKAEFEALMGDVDSDGDGDHDMADHDGEADGEEEPEGDVDFGGDEEDEDQLNEYVNQVGGKQYNQYGKMGDNGQNTKSVVAGKNDMGGTAKNLNQGGESNTGGTKGGLLNPSTKDLASGNGNVPGGKMGDTFKKNSAGHGPEKKGAGEKAGNTNSPLNGAPGRAK